LGIEGELEVYVAKIGGSSPLSTGQVRESLSVIAHIQPDPTLCQSFLQAVGIVLGWRTNLGMSLSPWVSQQMRCQYGNHEPEAPPPSSMVGSIAGRVLHA